MFVCTYPFPFFDRSQDLTKLFEVIVTRSVVTAATSSNVDSCYGVSISADLVQFGLQDDFRLQNQKVVFKNDFM